MGLSSSMKLGPDGKPVVEVGEILAREVDKRTRVLYQTYGTSISRDAAIGCAVDNDCTSVRADREVELKSRSDGSW